MSIYDTDGIAWSLCDMPIKSNPIYLP